MDTSVFETIPQVPQDLVTTLVSNLQRAHGKSYPWAIGKGRLLATPWQKEKGLPKRTTYHFFCRFSISTDAQHPGTDR